MKGSLLVLLGLFVSSLAHAAVPPVFKYLNNALWSADRQGCFSKWWLCDEKITLDEATELPVRFLFNSKPRYVSDGCLGYGWWFPLLESTVTQSDETEVTVHSPGGFVYRLFRDPKKPDAYDSLDAAIAGKLLPGDAFEVVDKKEGWKFRYHKGRIVEATTPKGDELRWAYDGTRVGKISSKKKGDLLTARYGPTGHLERFELVPNKYWTEFGYTEFPVMAKALGKALPVRMLPSVGSIKDNQDYQGKIGYRPDEDGLLQAMSLEEQLGKGKQHDETFKWNVGSGAIASDGNRTYNVEIPEGVAAGARAKIVATDRDGKRESYSYDEKTGIWEHGLPDGSVKRTYFMLTPGMGYGKARKIETIEKGSTEPRLLALASFDNQGRTIRERIADALETTQYGAGLSRVVTKRDAGGSSILQVLKYDSLGRLVEKTEKNETRTDYVYEGASPLLHERITHLASGLKREIFDDRGDVVRCEYPDGSAEVMTYLSRGQLSRHVLRSGAIREFKYSGSKQISRLLNGKLTWSLMQHSQTGALYEVNFGSDGMARSIYDTASKRLLGFRESRMFAQLLVAVEAEAVKK
ncbi:RHS repeat protein [Verrucomicrobium spinosum]|uniref:RHS repeat protein n=2 Tax=Verrucomicrobium spinosum TaxID=2736 RepID=UPI0001745E34|nr:RHS repeat protein [Verrucomicrobium spinosum]